MDAARCRPSCGWSVAVLVAVGAPSWGQTGGCSQKADMPTARYGLSTSVVDGRIYAIGGTGTTNGLHAEAEPSMFVATAEMYDPETDRWTQKADMPTPRLHVCTSVVDGKIYAIGGRHTWDSGNPWGGRASPRWRRTTRQPRAG